MHVHINVMRACSTSSLLVIYVSMSLKYSRIYYLLYRRLTSFEKVQANGRIIALHDQSLGGGRVFVEGRYVQYIPLRRRV